MPLHDDFTSRHTDTWTWSKAAFRHWFFENNGNRRLADADVYRLTPRRKSCRTALLWLAQFWWRIQYDPDAKPQQKHFA